MGHDELTLREFICRLVHDVDSSVTRDQGESLYDEIALRYPDCDFTKYSRSYSEWLEKYYTHFQKE